MTEPQHSLTTKIPESSSVSVVQRFVDCARRFPDSNAIFSNGEYVTYRQLAARVADLCAALRVVGADTQPRIGLVNGDDADTYAGLLAILTLGAACVPLHHTNPASRNSAIIEDANLQTVIAGKRAQSASNLPDNIVILKTADIDCGTSSVFPIAQISADSLALILFTSGSTGTPKGVCLAHSNLSVFFSIVIDGGYFDLSQNDRVLQFFDLTFDLGVLSTFLPLCTGGCIYVVPFSRAKYVSAIEIMATHKITYAMMVPSVLGFLERHFADISLPAMRYSLLAGEGLPHELTRNWHQCVPNAKIINAYGPTEATIYVTWHEWRPEHLADRAPNGLVPVGQPMPGTKVVLVDDDEQPVADGDVGELCIAGPQVAHGYWNNPVVTQRAFAKLAAVGDNAIYYRTGDLCARNEAGEYYFLGRKDFQVKLGGFRIELSEVEHHARILAGRPLVAAVVIPGAQGTQAIHLFVEGPSSCIEGLSVKLADALPVYMVPRHIHAIPTMPLNPNGKIDRQALITLA